MRRPMARRLRGWVAGAMVLAAATGVLPAAGDGAGKGAADDERARAVAPAVVCRDKAASDQDDMCLWLHPTDRSQSTVIASDKAAGRLFVYDLDGRTLQSIKTPMPGNIDVRYGFSLSGRTVDIVALNQRARPHRVVVFGVDPATRRLERIDNGTIRNRTNYGGTLLRSTKTGKVYFITTSKEGGCEQYELADDGTGKVKGTKVRSWKVGYSEAAVGDDRTGKVYVAEETKGIWEFPGEPDDPSPGRLVIKVGENDLRDDVEGLAIHPDVGGSPCLLVSNQSRNNFKVYRLDGKFTFVGTFAVEGARDTDGIDVTAADLGGRLAGGLFACHTDDAVCPVLLVPWARIAAALGAGPKGPAPAGDGK